MHTFIVPYLFYSIVSLERACVSENDVYVQALILAKGMGCNSEVVFKSFLINLIT